MNTKLNADQKQHLLAFNKFATMDNEDVALFIDKNYRGVGQRYLDQLNDELGSETYTDLSKNLLLFGNIRPEDNCRIFFMEELEGMEDDEIITAFANNQENGNAIISYFYQNRMAGFDVEEIKSTFNITDDYLKQHFAPFFAMAK